MSTVQEGWRVECRLTIYSFEGYGRTREIPGSRSLHRHVHLFEAAPKADGGTPKAEKSKGVEHTHEQSAQLPATNLTKATGSKFN